ERYNMNINSDKYELLVKFNLRGKDIEKWRLKRSGLVLYNVKDTSPLVHGEFFLATEIHRHDGCPHTLEHLVFMGSEDYPYKGFLDTIVSKCFAQGTNAWTATDHTAYTLSTAGSEGFLQALPIFLDHILYPTLTDESYVTEIHHIDGKGHDSGVVYCEMQARQHKQFSIVDFELRQMLFTNDTGYKSETGGLLEDIRKLDVDTIRQYHKDYYRPDNMGILVVGQVETEQIFATLDAFEQKIMSKGTLTPMVRPFQEKPVFFDKSISKDITYGSEDETIGAVYLSFKGIEQSEHKLSDALSVLMNTLTHTSQQTTLSFDKSIKGIVSEPVIMDFLYGEDKTNLTKSISLDIFDELLVKDEAFWLNLIKRFFIDQPVIEIVAIPSTAESKRLTEVETLRTEKQIQELGEEKIKQLGERLKQSQEVNEKPIDKELFDGEEVSHEDMDLIYLKTFITYSATVGMKQSKTPFSQLCVAKFKVTQDNYLDAVGLVRSLIGGDIRFVNSRIKVIAQQMFDDISPLRNEGQYMVSAMTKFNLYHHDKSNQSVLNFQRQYIFLEAILAKLAADPDTTEYVDKLNSIRDFFNNPSTTTVHVGADLYQLDDVKQVWIDSFDHWKDTAVARPPMVIQVLSDKVNERKVHQMLPLPGSTSGYFTRTHPTTFRYDSMLSNEFAALLLAIHYFEQMEGPFWKGLRGAGLTYNYDLYIDRESGILTFSCSKSSSLEKAFSESKRIVCDVISSGQLNPAWVQTAASSVLFEFVNAEKNVFKAIYQSLISHVIRKWPSDGYRVLLDKLFKISEQEIKDSLKHLSILFDDDTSNVAIVADTVKVDAVKGLFKDDRLNIISVESHFV
ncbi:hypothetical protein SAMD00019534_067700, partial [Acytostelium subglobosum LB1]|uniref:hypothetical protein n=1 Tax=Acytostelium subglobosum LB1 TaxID=1410327 RepID=UPI000644FC93